MTLIEIRLVRVGDDRVFFSRIFDPKMLAENIVVRQGDGFAEIYWAACGFDPVIVPIGHEVHIRVDGI